MSERQGGFTLIEIAIVLVIIGLLLGGVLKGQELITGARIRNLIQQQDGIKAAYLGFLDRYRALPGDYAQANGNIPGLGTVCTTGTPGNGNGDGMISSGPLQPHEHLLMWEHLSKAGFISGSYTCDTTASAATSPSNPYGSLFAMQHDAQWFQGAGTASRHHLKTGTQVPPGVLAEIDRKIDDGSPLTGSFRGLAPAGLGACYNVTMGWLTASGSASCEATMLF